MMNEVQAAAYESIGHTTATAGGLKTAATKSTAERYCRNPKTTTLLGVPM